MNLESNKERYATSSSVLKRFEWVRYNTRYLVRTNEDECFMCFDARVAAAIPVLTTGVCIALSDSIPLGDSSHKKHMV